MSERTLSGSRPPAPLQAPGDDARVPVVPAGAAPRASPADSVLPAPVVAKPRPAGEVPPLERHLGPASGATSSAESSARASAAAVSSVGLWTRVAGEIGVRPGADRAAAALGRRVGAALVDLGVVLFVVVPVFVLFELVWLWSEAQLAVPLLVQVGFAVSVPWVHAIVGEGLRGGATLGKRLGGIRVVRADGSAVGPLRALARRLVLDVEILLLGALALWLSVVRRHGLDPPLPLPPLLPVDYLLCVAFALNLALVLVLLRSLDRSGRFLHDFVAGSAVVNGSAAEFVAARAASSALVRRSAAEVSRAAVEVSRPTRLRHSPERGHAAPPLLARIVAARRRRRSLLRRWRDAFFRSRLFRARRPPGPHGPGV